jgi:hypothetical protein
VGLSIGESLLSETTIATIAASGALSDLLRRENPTLAQQAHGIGLDLLSGREGPAGTAVTLVLDRGGELSGPIDEGHGGISDTKGGINFDVGGSHGGISSQHGGLELSLGHVGEDGDAVEGRSTSLLLTLVAEISGLQVFQEDGEAVVLLFHGTVVSLVLGLETLPKGLLDRGILGVEAGRGGGSKGKCKNDVVDHFSETNGVKNWELSIR